MLKLGSQQIQIYQRGKHSPAVVLKDRFAARNWLQQFKGDSLSMNAIRRLLASDSSCAWRVRAASDEEVIEQAAHLLGAGLWHLHEQQVFHFSSDTQAVSSEPGEKGSSSTSTEKSGSAAKTVPLTGSGGAKAAKTAAVPDKKLHWIEIELLDDDGEPVAGAQYEVKLTDGSVRRGSLDDKGRARIDDIPPGMCSVYFPEYDAREWTAAK
jgi:hypothetical protein